MDEEGRRWVWKRINEGWVRKKRGEEYAMDEEGVGGLEGVVEKN